MTTPEIVETGSQKITRTGIYLLIFLLPLFFLPLTVNVLEFNKQALLIIAVLGSFFAWLLSALKEEKINLNIPRSSLLLITGFLVVMAMSTAFSSSPYNSFWGLPMPIASSFITTMAFALLAILIPHVFRGKEEIYGLVFLLSISALVVTIFSSLQLLGKFVLPLDFTKTPSFNPIGSVNNLGIFIACVMPLVVGLIFASRNAIRILLSVFVGLGILLLLMINYWVAWLCLLVAGGCFLVFNISRRDVFTSSLMFLPMFLIAVSIFMMFVKMPIFSINGLPMEVSPSLNASLDIAAKTIKERPSVSLLFGSGPSTFILDYSKYKPKEINQTVFWGTRFSSGSSELSDRLATTGILGLGFFLLMTFAVIFSALKGIIGKNALNDNTPGRALVTGVFASLLGVIISFVFYPANISIYFLFWVLVGITFSLKGKGKIIALVNKTTTSQPVAANNNSDAENGAIEGADKQAKQEKSSNLAAIGLSFTFTVLLIVGLGVLFVGTQRYMAEVNYLSALRNVQMGNYAMAVTKLSNALRLTGTSQDNYWRDIAQVDLFQISEQLQRTDISQEEIARQLNTLIPNAINSARMATTQGEKNPANWMIRGYVYANLVTLMNGADDWAINSYTEALKYEPTNPSIYNEIGGVYLVKADRFSNDKKENEAKEMRELARKNFESALGLKEDYASARFQLAMIDIREGKTKEAIEELEIARSLSPDDTGLAFQLGLVYRADKQIDKAQQEFERAIYIDPNYSNARYFLGLIYNSKNQNDKAIEQFTQINKLNPDNTEIKKILENLRAGREALSGIVANEPPIEEKPAEKLEKK